jgi:hypothetical protein
MISLIAICLLWLVGFVIGRVVYHDRKPVDRVDKKESHLEENIWHSNLQHVARLWSYVNSLYAVASFAKDNITDESKLSVTLVNAENKDQAICKAQLSLTMKENVSVITSQSIKISDHIKANTVKEKS